MHVIRIRTPAILRFFLLVLTMAVWLSKPVNATAASDDITVTMDVSIALSLDRTDPANPKMCGEGRIYGSCANGAGHGFVSVSVPDTLEMTTPAGKRNAPAGTAVEHAGSINARKGRANYEALNGINGKTMADLLAGKIRVTVPVTKDFLDYGAGEYSVTIPVTFTMAKGYGSYAENLDFTPWSNLVADGTVTVEDGKLIYVAKGDRILEIDPSVTELGNSLFNKSTYTEVVVPASVTAGSLAFGNGSVETVVFDEGCTEIPSMICNTATKLKKAVLPDSVEKINKYAFSNCSSLTEFNFPASLNYLGTMAFQKCVGIEEFDIHNDITLELSLGSLSPFNGARLKKVTVAEGVTKIPGSLCYNGCSELAELSLPSTLTEIGSSAFPNAVKLKEITIRSNLADALDSPFQGSGLEKITFVDGITAIPKNLFNGGCASVTELIIPSSVTAMGSDAFKGCASLKEFTLKNNITLSGTSSPFRGSGIEHIYFTDNVTVVPKNMFNEGCTSLKSLDIPAHIKSIGTRSFGGASLIEKVTIRSDLSMESGVVVSPFCGSDIGEIEVKEGVTVIPRYLFGEGVASCTKITLPDTLASIGPYAFKGCSSLPALDIPEAVTEIGGGAFEGSTSLESIVIKRDISFTGSVSPFYQSGVREVRFKNGVTKVADYMFSEGCSQMSSLHLPSTMQRIGKSAFKGCGSLTELTIRSDLTVTGVLSPFAGNTLTTVILVSGVTEVPDDLLCGECQGLRNLYVPVSLRSIGIDALKDGDAVTVYYAGNEGSWQGVALNYWEPYAVIYGAAQPATAGMLSMGRLTSRPTTLGMNSVSIEDGAEERGFSLQSGINSGNENAAVTPSTARTEGEDSMAVTPSTVRMEGEDSTAVTPSTVWNEGKDSAGEE